MRRTGQAVLSIGLYASVWLVRLPALAIAVIAGPTLIFVFMFPGSGMAGIGIAWICASATLGGAIAIGLIGVPGLIMLDLTHKDGLKPRLSLGAVVGAAATWVTILMLSQAGSPTEAGMGLLATLLGIGLGLFGAVLYWACSNWFERRIREFCEEAHTSAALTPEERREFGSRLDRNPW